MKPMDSWRKTTYWFSFDRLTSQKFAKQLRVFPYAWDEPWAPRYQDVPHTAA